MFTPIFNQMIFLFAFIVIGFILAKWKFLPDNSSQVLSKLENMLFMPALVMSTFITNFTVDTVSTYGRLFLTSGIMVAVLIVLSLLLAKVCFKENYLRKIATYGLAFSNFGFMGNAIMQGVFPEIFTEYVVFTMPLWFMIYLWGAPVLLISGSTDGEKVSLSKRLKSFANPMLIGMLIGMVLGITGAGNYIPTGLRLVIDVSGNCMSPVAMLLTGLTIGKIDVLALLKKWRIYLTTAVKLLVYPLFFIALFALIPQGGWIDDIFLKCGMCVAAMPMGLNTIVIPAAYGKDTSDAAGLALVSHIFSVGTIPLMFMLLQALVL